jgi:osmotically-inducible protein OsmY
VSPVDINGNIEAVFSRSSEIDARRVRVETRDGKVILHGRGPILGQTGRGSHAAWAAPGVTAVENDLTVAP